MSAGSAQPVRAGDRVNDVLARDEALVEVFVRHSQHFTKLRSRTMRRIMGRLVTVEDASRMAAVPLAELLRDLNGALGISAASEPAATTPAASAATAPNCAAPVHPADARIVEVDVRADLREGREPLARIMAATNALVAGEVLRVRAIFEPVPLFTVLGKRGFLHESTAHAADDWSVWFWRDAESAPVSADRVGSPAREAPAIEDSRTVRLDVRGLQPPEPLMRTLAALETLPEGHQLVHVNSRVPQLLLPRLAERGFACELDESHAEQVLLRIWRPA
jgi:TusA-related sulfurtransferase